MHYNEELYIHTHLCQIITTISKSYEGIIKYGTIEGVKVMDLRLNATIAHSFTTTKTSTSYNLHISLLLNVVICFKFSRNPLLYLSDQ